MTHAVRATTGADAESVVRLLDAAMLSFDRERVRDRVREGDALVAVVRGHNREERRAAGAEAGDDRVVGACVLRRSGEGPVGIEQIAVHRSRRGRGIGAALVEAAATRTDGPLVARFRGAVRPFYESLGFAIDAPAGGGSDAGSDRLRGTLR